MTSYLNILNLKLKAKTQTELIGWRKAVIWLHLEVQIGQMIARNLIFIFVTFQELYILKIGELSGESEIIVSKEIHGFV